MNGNKNYLIFGSGRWSKIYIKTLYSIISKEDSIYIYSKKNQENIINWIEKNSLRKVYVLKNLENLSRNFFVSAFVVNSPESHFKSIEYLVEKDIPGLIEKPIVFTSIEMNKLTKMIKNKKKLLFSSQVFTYSVFLKEAFSIIKNFKPFDKAKIYWHDPDVELRYGDLKRSNQLIDIELDYLPHIFSIINFLTNKKLYFEKINKTKREKNSSKINLFFKNLECQIDLKRNSTSRKRIFRFSNKDGYFHMNFSSELIEFEYSIDEEKKLLNLKNREGALKDMISLFINSIERDEKFYYKDFLKCLEDHQIIFNILEHHKIKLKK